MKVCEVCGDEISTKDGDNRCAKHDGITQAVTPKRRENARKARSAREDALRSLGLTKVRGALGGTYWE